MRYTGLNHSVKHCPIKARPSEERPGAFQALASMASCRGSCTTCYESVDGSNVQINKVVVVVQCSSSSSSNSMLTATMLSTYAVHVIHWYLMRFYSLQSCGRSWYIYKPPPVNESPTAKILWDFRLFTANNHPSDCLDIVLYDFCQQQTCFIEISCPADINVITKEDKKTNKYCSLAADLHQMYNMPVTIIPVVLGCTSVVSSHFLQF